MWNKIVPIRAFRTSLFFEINIGIPSTGHVFSLSGILLSNVFLSKSRYSLFVWDGELKGNWSDQYVEWLKQISNGEIWVCKKLELSSLSVYLQFLRMGLVLWNYLIMACCASVKQAKTDSKAWLRYSCTYSCRSLNGQYLLNTSLLWLFILEFKEKRGDEQHRWLYWHCLNLCASCHWLSPTWIIMYVTTYSWVKLSRCTERSAVKWMQGLN